MEFDIRTAHGNATNEFQKRFKLPQGTSMSKDASGGVLQASWQDDVKGLVELYRVGDENLLIFIEGVNPGYYYHIRHRDFDLLKKYAEDVFNLLVPTGVKKPLIAQ